MNEPVLSTYSINLIQCSSDSVPLRKGLATRIDHSLSLATRIQPHLYPYLSCALIHFYSERIFRVPYIIITSKTNEEYNRSFSSTLATHAFIKMKNVLCGNVLSFTEFPAHNIVLNIRDICSRFYEMGLYFVQYQ